MWLAEKVSWKLDPYLLRLTGGRISTAWPIPAALLETRGARTGRPRRNATIYFHDGDRVTIVASYRGEPRHPAWYHNVQAHPDVVYGGQQFRADIVTHPAEQERLWALADQVFPPFTLYRDCAGEPHHSDRPVAAALTASTPSLSTAAPPTIWRHRRSGGRRATP
jgi:deazaflavin-dependent oxidoreductase (nitroreductase family)